MFSWHSTGNVSLLTRVHSAAHYQKRKVINSPIQLGTLRTTVTTCMARYAHWCNSTVTVLGVTYWISFKACSMRYETLLVRPRTCGLIDHEPEGKTYY